MNNFGVWPGGLSKHLKLTYSKTSWDTVKCTFEITCISKPCILSSRIPLPSCNDLASELLNCVFWKVICNHWFKKKSTLILFFSCNNNHYATDIQTNAQSQFVTLCMDILGGLQEPLSPLLGSSPLLGLKILAKKDYYHLILKGYG